MKNLIDLALALGQTGITITKTSPHTGKDNDMFLPISMSEYRRGKKAWKAGMLSQKAFPKLNVDQREFIMTGLTQEDWKDILPDQED